MTDSPIRDDGDRSDSKIATKTDKQTEAPEKEVVDRQLAPKVSVKVERQKNLGDYNSVTAQVFMSSGTLERYRGDLLNEDGEIKAEIQKEMSAIVSQLQDLARNRVLDAIKKETEVDIEVTGN